MSNEDFDTERAILNVMKKVLTDVAKETFTRPGFKHPLTDETIENMRQCLGLIASRELEIAKSNGESMDKRPRYIDEARNETGSVVVKLDTGLKDKKDSE